MPLGMRNWTPRFYNSLNKLVSYRLLGIEARVWLIVYIYAILAGHITGWCASVSTIRYQEWIMFVNVVLCYYVWVVTMKWNIVKKKYGADISYFYRIAPMGTPNLTTPSDGRIAINNKHVFRRNELRRNLRFKPPLYWSIKYRLMSCPTSFLIPFSAVN